MRKPLKIAAILVAVVIGLLALLAIALFVFVDPNRYRDDIVRAVKQQTGRELTIEGDLRLSLFPWIGLETDRLALSNAPGFGSKPFAVVESSQTKVELLPLLRKQVVVDAVRLNGLKLNLARNAKGQTNWEDMAAQADKEPATQPAPKNGGGPGAALAAFTINRFEVRNSEFTWRDDSAKTEYAVRGLDLTSGDLLGDTPAPLKLAFNLESTQPPIRERVQLDARLRFDPAKEALEVPELRLTAGDLRVNAQLTASNVLSAPKAAGAIEIPPFNARALLQRLGVAYQPADADVLQKVGLRMKLAHDAKTNALSDLRVTLDDTQLTGNLAVQREPAAAYRFDLALDNIDIDRYLPATTGPDAERPEQSSAEAAVIPLALLRDTDANGELRIGQLKAFGLRSQEVTVKVAAKGGRITLGPNAAKLYSGTYRGRTVLDASGKVPQFRFEEKLAGVQLGPLLKDADVFDRYSGTGDVSLNLTAQGLDANAIKRTLNGTAAVQLRDGKIQGVNLQKLVQQAQALLKQARGREVDGKTEAGDETAFNSLSATAKVTNGIARTDDLKLDGPVIRATGAGTANLAEEMLDYRLQVTLAEAEGRTGTTVPLRISGPFASPRYRVDVSALLKQQVQPAQEKLEERVEEKKDALRDKLRDRLREKLKR